MHTEEPASTIEATDVAVKIINSTYTKSNLDKVSEAAFPLDKGQHKKLSSLLM